jgi:hypothetical protein
MSSVVVVGDLPNGCESSYVFSELYLSEDEVEDVYTPPQGGNKAWIVFKSPEMAKAYVGEHPITHFGQNGKKVYSSLSTEAIPESVSNRYSDFIYARDHQVLSRTVEITGLPQNHTMRNMNELLEPVRERYDEETDKMLGPSDYDYFEPDEIVTAKSPEAGVGLVQLTKPHMAINVILTYAGTYWKNATLNARCVPDEVMTNLLINEPSEADVMLFVSGLKANTTSTEVREIFKDFPIRDVNIPPGGKTFCFVFVQQAHANSILALFGNGVKWQGRNVRVSLSEKDKRKQKSAFDTVGATTAMPPPTDTTDLKLVNLPYGIADSNIRIIFEGFAVYKVVVKQGYAFVGIATAEVGRAIDQLNDSMVGGRKIKVKVSERRKQ